MPQKLNSAGKMQNYVPKGNGDASGEYGDNATGSNKHFKVFQKGTQSVGQAQTTTQNANPTPTPTTTSKPKTQKKAFNQFSAQNQVNTPTQPQTPPQAQNQAPVTNNTITQVDSSYITKKSAKAIATYDRTSCITTLQSYSNTFDADKLDGLSDDDLRQLVIASQSQDILKKKIAKNVNDARLVVNNIINTESRAVFGWSSWAIKPADIDKIDDIGKYIDDKVSDRLQWSNKNPGNDWTTKDYQLWVNIQSQWNAIEAQYKNDDATLNKAFNDNAALIKSYKRTYNPNISSASNDNYSQEAKDDALWFREDVDGPNYLTRAHNYFKKYYNAMANKLTPQEQNALSGYTNAFSRINNPLRQRKYTGILGKSTGLTFTQDVKNMTSAIDKSVLTENVWVERGTDGVDFGGSIGYYNLKNGKLTQSQLNSLIGTCMEEQAFSSHTIAKSGTKNSYGTSGNRGGFVQKGVIFNTYCPVGTKGAYLEPISQNQNQYELLLQRGYSYKITKAYYTGNTLYIDREVILGSDDNKYDDATLKQLQNQYF